MESTNITWHETVTSNSNITGFNLYEYGTVTGHTAYETFNGTVKTATLSVYIGDIVNGTMSYQLSYIVRGRRIIHMFHQSGNMNIVFKYLDVNLEDSLYLTCPKIWGHWIRRSFDDVNWYAASENTLLHIDRLNFTDNGIYKCSHELFRDIYVINATRVGNIRKIVTKTIIIPMDIVDALISTMSIIKITAVAACLLGLFIFIVVVVWRKCASIRNVRSINDYSMMTV
jgi:hypothetical protein